MRRRTCSRRLKIKIIISKHDEMKYSDVHITLIAVMFEIGTHATFLREICASEYNATACNLVHHLWVYLMPV